MIYPYFEGRNQFISQRGEWLLHDYKTNIFTLENKQRRNYLFIRCVKHPLTILEHARLWYFPAQVIHGLRLQERMPKISSLI
jgi:hypothetical protein